MRAIDRTACALALALAASCAARLDANDWQTRLKARSDGDAQGAGDAGEPGTESGPDAPWRRGVLKTHSALRYGVARTRAAGDAERWTLEVHGPTAALTDGARADLTVTLDAEQFRYRSQVWPAAIAVGREGAELRREETRLALGFVGPDLWTACVRSRALLEAGVTEVEGEAREELLDACSRGAAACLFMGYTLGSSTELRGLASRIVQWPGLLSLMRFRIDVGISPYFSRVRPIETPFGPGLALPIELEVNGDQAFVGEFHLVEPGGALLLVAGIVAIEGLAPDRPDDRLRIELVGPVPHEADDPEDPPRRHGIVPALQRTRELAR